MYGYAFVKFQSIWVPIAIHFSWNFIQGAVFGFPVSGMPSEGILPLEITPDMFSTVAIKVLKEVFWGLY